VLVLNISTLNFFGDIMLETFLIDGLLTAVSGILTIVLLADLSWQLSKLFRMI